MEAFISNLRQTRIPIPQVYVGGFFPDTMFFILQSASPPGTERGCPLQKEVPLTHVSAPFKRVIFTLCYDSSLVSVVSQNYQLRNVLTPKRQALGCRVLLPGRTLSLRRTLTGPAEVLTHPRGRWVSQRSETPCSASSGCMGILPARRQVHARA